MSGPPEPAAPGVQREDPGGAAAHEPEDGQYEVTGQLAPLEVRPDPPEPEQETAQPDGHEHPPEDGEHRAVRTGGRESRGHPSGRSWTEELRLLAGLDGQHGDCPVANPAEPGDDGDPEERCVQAAHLEAVG